MDQEDKAAEPREDRNKVKKPYETPTLTKLGTIAEITHSLGDKSNDGMAASGMA